MSKGKIKLNQNKKPGAAKAVGLPKGFDLDNVKGMEGIKPLQILFMAQQSEGDVSITDIHGKEYTVSLRLASSKQIQAVEPMQRIMDKINAVASDAIPKAMDGATIQETAAQMGTAVLSVLPSITTAMLSQDLIDVASVVLGMPAEKVGDLFEAEELTALMLPFFGKLVRGMGGRLLPTEIPTPESLAEISG